MINILANSYTIDADWCYGEFSKHIKPDSKVLIIPFSFSDEQIYSNETWDEHYNELKGIYYNGVMEPFERYDVKPENITWLNYFDDSKKSAQEIVSNADVLYFTGGMPDKMMARLHDFNLLRLIEKHKGVIIGFSAGALIQLEIYHLSPENDYQRFRYCNGMKMIKNFNIEVHYNASKVQLESIKRVIKDTKKPVYAIEDEGALIVDNDKVIPVGKVHYIHTDLIVK